MNPKVDFYFDKAKNWQEELEQLRSILLDCGLSEELKWGVPCYLFQHSNIVLIHAFKQYCAVLFFKGALLSDPHGILIQQTKNVQAARQVRFTNVLEIHTLKLIIKSYVFEAVEVEKAGLKVPLKKATEYEIPEEFQKQLKKSKALKTAFEALTPGRQRGYYLYFSQPKQSSTREARIEKSKERILRGEGLNDR